MAMEIAPRQVWTYDAPPGYETSRIIIGTIEDVPGEGDIVCVTVTGAPLPVRGGGLQAETLTFVPFSRAALEDTLRSQEGEADLPVDFSDLRDNWMEETGGTEYLTIPLPLFLDMLAAGSQS